MVTTSDVVATVAASGSTTFATQHLIDNGSFRVLRVEIRNLTNAVATYSIDNGPTRSLVPYEVYILERNINYVACVTGSIEVVFQM